MEDGDHTGSNALKLEKKLDQHYMIVQVFNSINLFTNMLTLLLHFYHLQSESRFCVSRMHSSLYNTEVVDF